MHEVDWPNPSDRGQSQLVHFEPQQRKGIHIVDLARACVAIEHAYADRRHIGAGGKCCDLISPCENFKVAIADRSLAAEVSVTGQGGGENMRLSSTGLDWGLAESARGEAHGYH
jgi:hypothetical protein